MVWNLLEESERNEKYVLEEYVDDLLKCIVSSKDTEEMATHIRCKLSGSFLDGYEMGVLDCIEIPIKHYRGKSKQTSAS